ncbi:MAG TPA: helix-turn-helix domain-containing protein [Alphaproteobacteria bacterium]|nr:helix-turn-helix domain-containing protein [Alphaproteobacteria bacterium]
MLARDLLDLVGDRWSALVIYALRDGPLRFSDLKNRIDEYGPKRLRRTEISHKMLAGTLRRLRRDGLVVHAPLSEGARHAEYALSPLGRSFWAPMMAVHNWTLKHQEEIEAARRRFGEMETSPSRDTEGP